MFIYIGVLYLRYLYFSVRCWDRHDFTNKRIVLLIGFPIKVSHKLNLMYANIISYVDANIITYKKYKGTHTQTRTNAYTHKHTKMHILKKYPNWRVHTHVYTQMHTHICTHTHMPKFNIKILSPTPFSAKRVFAELKNQNTNSLHLSIYFEYMTLRIIFLSKCK